MAYRASADDSAQYPPAGVAWYALIVLLLLYFMYFVDRNILTLLVAPVRKDLGINDSQIGLLNGYSFSLLNGLFAIPFGWYADRHSRKQVLVFGIAIWGCSTIASGFTTTFTQLMFTRMGLGLGEAALAPVAFSLISDYFRKDKRGSAVGVYGIGGFGGIGLSYLIGGAVLAAFRGVDTVNLPFIGSAPLWHAAFIAVGSITLFLAIVTCTIKEPPRIDSLQRGTSAMNEVGFFAHIREHWQAFWLVIGGYTCLGILAIGWFAWLPSYFIRVFHMAPVQAGIQVGWTTTIAGVTGAVVGGVIADRLMKRGARGGKVLNLFIMFCCWVVCALGVLFSHSITMSLVWVFIFTFADGIGFMQYGNVMQEMFPAHLRARSVAAWGVCSSMLSYGVGPLLFGLSTDFVFHGDDGLRFTLGLVSLPIIAIGLLCSWFARRPYDRARLAVDPTVNVDMEWLAAPPAAVVAQPQPR